MNIKILNSDFDLIGEIDNYDTLRWTRRWHKPGDMQLTISANAKHADKLVRGNILLHGTKSALITGKSLKISETATGSETLTVNGVSCASICGRRLILPPTGLEYDIQNNAAETVLKNFVYNTFTTDLNIAPDLGRGGAISFSGRFDNLGTILEQLSVLSGIGWDIYVDRENKRFVFEVYEGVNRGAGNANPVVFRPDFGNIRTQSYTENEDAYRNVAIVAGQGDGIDRAVETVGSATGLDRREVFIDARDISESSELITRGEQKLADYPLIKTFECDVLDTKKRKYGVNWNLGDIVTVKNKKWGVSMDARIVEVVEEYSRAATKISTTFGTGKILVSDAIKTVTSQAEKMLRVSGANSYLPLSGGDMTATPTVNGKTVWHDGNAAVVIESGSNANGYYEKYSNGDLKCWFKLPLTNLAIDTATGSGYYKSAGSWTFPQAFVGDTPDVTATANSSYIIFACTSAQTLTGATIRLGAFSSLPSVNGTVSLRAIGKWK